jgi:aspartate kinase
MKFGGTSVASAELINNAARRVAQVKKTRDPVVVVSAMGHTTDELVRLSRKITAAPGAREMDMLVTAGERISVALFSMALERLDLKAMSFTGSQVGIITDNRHQDARILEIRGDRIKQALACGRIPVVCGFQGVSLEKEITTLGRGGSDTTAVALSVALRAKECMIFTDVEGVFTEDPNDFPGVKKIDRISYEEMLELASRGAQVLHPRACGIATRFNMPVYIKSSFNKKAGTLIAHLDSIERPRPRAITHSEDLYLVTLVQVPRKPTYLSQITTELTAAGVILKFFFHGISEAKNFDLSFITPLSQRKKARAILDRVAKKLNIKQIKEITEICSVSIIGAGIGSENRILAEIFCTLSKAKVHVEAATTSELSVNLFMKKKYLKRAVSGLLREFDLIQPH